MAARNNATRNNATRTHTVPLRPRRRLWAMGLLAIVLGIFVIARIPVSTDQGVNGVVTSYRIPLYVKTLDFLQREVNYGRLAESLTRSASGDEARALQLFDWTRANIRDVPSGFPVVDDHVWNIVIRGYGQDDQKADVFTTLAAYAGLRAYWMLLRRPPRAVLPISLVQIEHRWRVFDVANGIVFRNSRGELATPEELASDPALVATLAGPTLVYGGHPYDAYFKGFQAPTPPDLTRAEIQMFWPRLEFQVRRLTGLGRRQ